MRVFLTGVSGGLGKVVAEQMARVPEVECITGIDVTEPKNPLLPKVQFVKMDVRSPDVAAKMAGHEIVVHTAFIVKWLAKMTASERFDINVNGTRNVAMAAVANRVRRFIHTSSTAAYDIRLVVGKSNVTEDTPLGNGNLSYYCNDKSAAERELVQVLGPSGITRTVLRPCAFVGPHSPGSVQGLRDAPAKMPGLDPRVQVGQEEDVAAAILQAVRQEMPGAYNVAPDDFIRMTEVWRIARMRVFMAPVPVMRLLVGFRWRYMGLPTHPSWVGGSFADFTVSNAKLKGTGWRPRYSSADALRTGV